MLQVTQYEMIQYKFNSFSAFKKYLSIIYREKSAHISVSLHKLNAPCSQHSDREAEFQGPTVLTPTTVSSHFLSPRAVSISTSDSTD